MPISFNDIPAAIRVPSMVVEFDSSKATDNSLMTMRALCVGQKLATGIQAALVPVRVTSPGQAATLFGAGSMLAQMCAAYLKNDAVTALWAIAVEDDPAGVAATGSITLAGAATESGTLCVYIGGRKVKVGVVSGAQAADVATLLAAAVGTTADCPVTATAAGAVVTLAAAHKGAAANGLDIRPNYNGESTPAGLTLTIAAMHGGTGNPEAEDIIAAMGDTQYNVIAWPWTDASTLDVIKDELARRWGPLIKLEGVAIAAAAGVYGVLAALGESHNSKHLCLIEAQDVINPVWEYAAMASGDVAYFGGMDPARQFQTLALVGAQPKPEAERLIWTERNLLLFDGVSTVSVDANNTVRLERLITTYRKSPNGADDTAYLDLCTPLTLSYLRYSFVNRIKLKYPRHKLADDGTNYGPGQAIITPKVGRAEAIAWARAMEAKGLMENINVFAANVICERNLDDRDRMDWYLPPDLVNQFVVGAAQMGFIL